MHQERQAQLEESAEEARSVLAEQRELLDSADVVSRFAAEMSEFLKTSDVTETKAFIWSSDRFEFSRPLFSDQPHQVITEGTRACDVDLGRTLNK